MYFPQMQVTLYSSAAPAAPTRVKGTVFFPQPGRRLTNPPTFSCTTQRYLSSRREDRRLLADNSINPCSNLATTCWFTRQRLWTRPYVFLARRAFRYTALLPRRIPTSSPNSCASDRPVRLNSSASGSRVPVGCSCIQATPPTRSTTGSLISSQPLAFSPPEIAFASRLPVALFRSMTATLALPCSPAAPRRGIGSVPHKLSITPATILRPSTSR